LAAYETCPRQYFYHYILKWRPLGISANLVFGTVVHRAIEGFLIGQHEVKPVDPVALFDQLWQQHTQTEIHYGAKWTSEDLVKVGRSLLAQFVPAWHEQGLAPLIDRDNKPAVELDLNLPIGNDIEIACRIDLLAMTPEGKVRVVDFKTPAQPCDEGYTLVADQTLAYQVVADHDKDRLGIEQVDEIQFVELVKQKSKPRVIFGEPVPRRPDEQVEEYLNKVSDTAQLIRRERFPRRAGMAHATSCAMCDYRLHCQTGSVAELDMASLVTSFPSSRRPRGDGRPVLDAAA